jgi:hypothetical protein
MGHKDIGYKDIVYKDMGYKDIDYKILVIKNIDYKDIVFKEIGYKISDTKISVTKGEPAIPTQEIRQTPGAQKTILGFLVQGSETSFRSDFAKS